MERRVPGKSRIAFLLPNLQPGGAERMSINLANEFVARGVGVDMVLMRRQGSLLALLDPRIRVFDLGARRPRHVLLPLIRHMRDNPVDGFLASIWPLTVLAVLARMFSGASFRIIAVEHTTWSGARLAQKWRTRMAIRATMRWLLPRADAVVAVSKGAAVDLERFAGLRSGSVRAIYNPAARRHGVEGSPPPDGFVEWSDGSRKRVLAVGTLKAVKDFPTLLRAFARMEMGAEARLLILGEGTERPALERLLTELGLEGRVELPGAVVDPAPFYAKADLFVLSSTNEGFGNVIVEALEHGVPVVSTDCPSGPREILENGEYGALVPVGDADAMARAMDDALCSDHDTQKLKRRAQDFSVDKAADAYLDLLLGDA